MSDAPGDPFGLPVDPDDEAADSPNDWLASEWLDDTWDGSERIEPSAPVQRWRRGTVSGALLSAVALGLREALEVPREEAPIEIQASGEPAGPRRVEVDLDPDDPSGSVVRIRTWVPPRD